MPAPSGVKLMTGFLFLLILGRYRDIIIITMCHSTTTTTCLSFPCLGRTQQQSLINGADKEFIFQNLENGISLFNAESLETKLLMDNSSFVSQIYFNDALRLTTSLGLLAFKALIKYRGAFKHFQKLIKDKINIVKCERWEERVESNFSRSCQACRGSGELVFWHQSLNPVAWKSGKLIHESAQLGRLSSGY